MALILASASSCGITSTPPTQIGQRLGATWSSMMTADTPAASNSRIVRITLMALP